MEPEQLVALAVRFREKLGVVESRITGRSMQATLPPGSRIRIQCGAPDPVVRGTVVAFVGRSALMAHRVVRRGRGPRARGFLLTRGDSTIVCDAPIHIDNVLGVVTHVAAVDQWRPLLPVRRGLVARLAAGIVSGTMTLAMEIDTRAARAIALTCLRVRAIWLGVRRRVRRTLGAPS